MLESTPDLYWVLPLGVCVILVLVALLAAGARPSETAPPAFPIFDNGEKKKPKPKKKTKENIGPSAKAAVPSSAPSSSSSRSAVVDLSGEPVKVAKAAKGSSAAGSVTKPAAPVAVPTANKKDSQSGSSRSAAGAKLKPSAGTAAVDAGKPSSAKPDGASGARQQQRPAKQQPGWDEQAPWQVQLSKKTKKQNVAVASVTASTTGGASIKQYEAAATFVKELIPTSSTDKKPNNKAVGASQQQLSGSSLASVEVADASSSSVAASSIHESRKQQLTEGAAAPAEPSKVTATATQKRDKAGTNTKSASDVSKAQSAAAVPATKSTADLAEDAVAAAGATGAAENLKQDGSTSLAGAQLTAAISKVTNTKTGTDSPGETSTEVHGASQDNVAFDELGGWQEAKSMRPVKTAKAKKARRE